ncbi:MAG: glycosyl hydrolase 2 galactose-binding domain-containing protein [Elusimicrobiota bacterium]
MTIRSRRWAWFAALIFCASGAGRSSAAGLSLQDGWRLESSCRIAETGERISMPSYQDKSWHRGLVPGTVVGALVADKTYPDPNYSMNLRAIPGADYPLGENFSNFPMSSTSPFHCSWWYRKEFSVPSDYRAGRTWLHLDGVNYRANLWLNGRKLGDAADLAGAWRVYELDVTTSVLPGKTNVLAVEVFAPTEKDLAITWVDWNPAPPDKNMGLFRPVYLTRSGPVALRRPQVKTDLAPDLKAASLTATAELINASSRSVSGVLHAEWEGGSLRQTVALGAGESRRVVLSPENYPALRMRNPRLWWPYQMGKPDLYAMRISFTVSGAVSDAAAVNFGIRKITSELTPNGALLFKVNGRKVLVRGGGWSPDMLLRQSRRRLESEFDYVRHLNLNTVRLEGKLESDEFFDLADRYGILVMAGWCCCDMWEKWADWKPEQYRVAAGSLKDQIDRLRNHPSLLVWLNGSDNPPPADVETMYLDILRSRDWPNPIMSSASGSSTTVTGASGVLMDGPYDYVPPSFWLVDKEHGGAHVFNTETSPGPSIPTKESMCRILPAEHRWPVDAVWNYHAGGTTFANTITHDRALERRYGKPASMEEFSIKSQAMAYEGERAMFEAFARNKYAATGVIQWMLNNAWPSTIWHLYDYYLVPGGGYFGTRKACEPVHIQYSYDDRSIVVVNGLDRPLNGLTVRARIFDLAGTEKYSRDLSTSAPSDSSTRAFLLPELSGLTTTYFLKLSLRDGDGKSLSDNFYWLSTKQDVADWAHYAWDHTPQTSYADFTALNGLAPARLKVSARARAHGEENTVSAIVENAGEAVAFMVRLRLAEGQDAADISPVLWDDNYISLLPGEKRTISGRYRTSDAAGRVPALAVDGWNVSALSIKL